LLQLLLVDKKIRNISALSEGVDVGVFNEQKMILGNFRCSFPPVPYLLIQDIFEKHFLIFPGIFIIPQSQLFKLYPFIQTLPFYLSLLLFIMIKAAITPGTQPNRVRISTMRMEPQPLSRTARGGKRIDNITLQILIICHKDTKIQSNARLPFRA
jgi:hypothetical protein